MRALFEELSNVLAEGEEAVLVTIVASSDSTPRGAGSRMLIKKGGTIKGIIGGDIVEYQTILTAVEAIKHKSFHTEGFTLTRSRVANTDMAHGGDVVVYLQYISPDNKGFVDFCMNVRTALSRDKDSWLLPDITDETCWQVGLYSENTGLPGMNMPERFTDPDLFGCSMPQREAEGRRYYAGSLMQADTVHVFDGGHVAQELIPVPTHVGFRCVVTDDREEFADPQIFPTVADTIIGDLERIGGYIKTEPCNYICVMTRGHQFDYCVQKQTMTFRPCYIKIMGSRNKIRVATGELLGDGLSREEIEGYHMPIGTEIHAETPAEIAISIVGELINVKAAGMDLRSKIDGQK